MAQLKCENLVLGYDSKPVVSGLSFEVNEGDYLYVIGENGSGKSTLMKTLLGLSSPISGKIEFSDGVGKKQLGYLPQQTAVQRDFPASVKEIVLSGTVSKKFSPFYTKEQRETAEKNMERMGITEISSRCYRELSGGQQQRVLLARALCAARKMILLDEPAAGLDPVAMQEMYAVIHDLNQKDGMTVIMVSHDIGAAVKYSKHILHLGKTQLFFGTTADYLKSDIGRAFLSTSNTL